MLLLLFVPLLVAVAGCYTGQGSGTVALQSYDVADFTRISLSSEGVVRVLPGDFGVVATAEDNVLPTVRVYRQLDTLVLGRDVDWIDGVRPTVPIEFTVYAPGVESVAVSGSGRAVVRGIATARQQFTVSGSGVIDIAGIEADRAILTVEGSGSVFGTDIQVVDLQCRLSGSAQVGLSGTVETLSLVVAGSGLYRGSRLRSRDAKVHVGGAGQAFLWVPETLAVQVNGSGRVSYRGAPAVTESIQRDGELMALNEPADEEGA